MTLHAIFWTFALANMAAAFCAAGIGVYFIRARQIERHRRMMRLSAVLVGVFVVAYFAKVALLGREDLSEWTRLSLSVLRIHESFVLVFILAGGCAMILSGKISSSAPSVERLRRLHRRAGKVALISFGLALLTAALTYGALLTEGGTPLAKQVHHTQAVQVRAP